VTLGLEVQSMSLKCLQLVEEAEPQTGTRKTRIHMGDLSRI
jgi:hypothetical protein